MASISKGSGSSYICLQSSKTATVLELVPGETPPVSTKETVSVRSYVVQRWEKNFIKMCDDSN